MYSASSYDRNWFYEETNKQTKTFALWFYNDKSKFICTAKVTISNIGVLPSHLGLCCILVSRCIFNTIKTSGHSSLEKYTSHTLFSKGLGKGWYWLCVRGELETEQRLQHINPPTPLDITFFLSRFPGLFNRGPRGPASAGTWLSFQHLLSNWSELPVAGVYNNLTRTYFLQASQFALNSTPRQSMSPLISWYLRPDAAVIYTDAFLLLTAWLVWRSICNSYRIPWMLFCKRGKNPPTSVLEMILNNLMMRFQ